MFLFRALLLTPAGNISRFPESEVNLAEKQNIKKLLAVRRLDQGHLTGKILRSEREFNKQRMCR